MSTMITEPLGWLRLGVGIYWRIAGLKNSLMTAPALDPGRVIMGAWIVFAVYWLVSAFGRAQAQRKEPRIERLGHVLWLSGAAYLLYSSEPWMGALNRRFLPDWPWIGQLGAWLTLVGIAFAIWARYHLGKNWSGDVTIRQDHKLIRTGPYAWVRHPIYTGMLIALAGTALWVARYRALVGLAMFLVGFRRKANKEEAFLAQQFGSDFEQHRQHTGFFLPHLG